jgi:hypothetical protein
MASMTNKEAFDIVLELAKAGVITNEDLVDNPELEGQQVDQKLAIMLTIGIRDALVKEVPGIMS